MSCSGCAVVSGFSQLVYFRNEKGAQEGPCAPPEFWMALAIPGGAPGYDDDKQFGNFITHLAARASQRLRDHSVQTPYVKAKPRWRRDAAYLGLRAAARAFLVTNGLIPASTRQSSG